MFLCLFVIYLLTAIINRGMTIYRNRQQNGPQQTATDHNPNPNPNPNSNPNPTPNPNHNHNP